MPLVLTPEQDLKYEAVGEALRSLDTEFLTEIGDVHESAFLPQVKISRWDNEVNFSARLIDPYPARASSLSADGNNIVWGNSGIQARFYDLGGFGDGGGFEFALVLGERPPDNVLAFTLQHKGLAFYPQPALTPDEIGEGAYRAPEIINSWAVYHATQRNHRIGGHNYRSGKAFHIHRPWAKDANGVRVWCDLDIDPIGSMAYLTVPADFLAVAAYPILVDPTFGYTTGGSTNVTKTSASNQIGLYYGTYTATTGDEISEFAVYGSSISGSPTSDMCAYTVTGGAPDARLGSPNTVTITAGTGWDSVTSLTVTMGNGVEYTVAIGNYVDSSTMWYDGGVDPERSYHSTPGAMPATWSESGTSFARYSIYATYANTGGGGTILPAMMSHGHFNGGMV